MGSRYTKFSAYLASDTPEEVKKKQQQNAYAYVERAMDGVDGYELDSSYDEAKKKGILAVYDQYYNEHYADLGMPTTGKTYAQQNSDSGGSGASGGGFGSGGSGYSVYDPYEDSRYMEALNALKQAQSNLPIYANSYEDEIRDVYNSIVNRDKFTYDVNSDALYNQYKDQYVSLGKLAMQDTMGQAAALTGGYGNSYAASVGNQAYQSYISQLNQIVPELYGMAYDRYRDEGQDLLNQYNMLGDMRDTEYNRYLNELTQYWNNVNYYKSLLDDAYNQGYTANRDAYNMYIDERNFAYQQQQDALAQQNYLNEFEYKKAQDALQQQNYEKEFDYKKWEWLRMRSHSKTMKTNLHINSSRTRWLSRITSRNSSIRSSRTPLQTVNGIKTLLTINSRTRLTASSGRMNSTSRYTRASLTSTTLNRSEWRSSRSRCTSISTTSLNRAFRRQWRNSRARASARMRRSRFLMNTALTAARTATASAARPMRKRWRTCAVTGFRTTFQVL